MSGKEVSEKKHGLAGDHGPQKKAAKFLVRQKENEATRPAPKMQKTAPDATPGISGTFGKLTLHKVETGSETLRGAREKAKQAAPNLETPFKGRIKGAAAGMETHLIGRRDASGKPMAVSNARYHDQYSYAPDGSISRVDRTEGSGQTHVFERRADGWYRDGRKADHIKDVRIEENGDLTTVYKSGSKRVDHQNDGSSTTYGAHGSMIERDKGSRIITVTYPDGYQTKFGYDRAGRLISREGRPGSGPYSQRYVSADGGATWRDPDGKCVREQVSLDLNGTERITYSDGRSILVRLDGSRIEIARDHSRHTVYSDHSEVDQDSHGRVTCVVRAGGVETDYGYDAKGRLNSRWGPTGHWVSDDGGKTWSGPYFQRLNARIRTDGYGNEHREYPDGRAEVLRRDGSKLEIANNGARHTVYPDRSAVDQDSQGRVIHVRRSDGVELKYGYDGHGNLTSWEGPTGSWKSSDGGKTWVGPLGIAIRAAVTVDENGDEHRVFPDNKAEILGRDGRTVEIKDGSRHIVYLNQSQVDEDSQGRVVHVRRTDGVEIKYGYDSHGNLSSWEGPTGSWTSSDGGKTWVGPLGAVSDVAVNIDKSGNEHRVYPDGSSQEDCLNGQKVFLSRDRTSRIIDPDGTERVEFADGAENVRKPDGAGGYTEVHRRYNVGQGDPRPDENFAIIRKSDGAVVYAEVDQNGKPGKPLEMIDDDHQVEAARDRLANLAESKITNSAPLAKFKADMARFEQRSKKIEDLYRRQGKSEAEAHRLTHEQVRRSYELLARLLAAKDNPTVGLSAQKRAEIAEQVMAHAATPTLIDQGTRGTCNVTDVESRTYIRNPKEAIRLVVDVATTGRYETTDSIGPPQKHPPVIVAIGKDSLAPDDEAKRSNPPADHCRGLASQIFQITAVNIYYRMQDPTGRTRYEQRQDTADSPVPGPPDAVWDHSHTPPRKIASGVGKVDNTRIIKKIGDQINPQDRNYHWIVADDDIHISSAKDLDKRLKEAKEKGELPITIGVYTNNEPFDSHNSRDDGHVVNITDYIPGDPPKVCYDNSWGSAEDHNTPDKAVSIYDFCITYHEQFSKEQLPFLSQAVEYNRKHGVVSYLSEANELNWLAAKNNCGRLSDQEFDSELKQRLKIIREHYKGGKLSQEEYGKLVDQINSQIISGCRPQSWRFSMIEYEHSVGMFASEAEYDRYLGDTMINMRIKRDRLRADNEWTDNDERDYEQAIARYRHLFNQLPADRQGEMRQRVSEEVRKANESRRRKKT